MKNFLKILPIIMCSILMAAHLSRANMTALLVLSLLFPLILFWKSKLSARLTQVALIIFGLEWIRTLFFYAQIRIENGEDWLRLAIIILTVATLNFATILVYRTRYMIERYNLG